MFPTCLRGWRGFLENLGLEVESLDQVRGVSRETGDKKERRG